MAVTVSMRQSSCSFGRLLSQLGQRIQEDKERNILYCQFLDFVSVVISILLLNGSTLTIDINDLNVLDRPFEYHGSCDKFPTLIGWRAQQDEHLTYGDNNVVTNDVQTHACHVHWSI